MNSESVDEISTHYSFFTEKRHSSFSIFPCAKDASIFDWRLRDRLKTVSVAIVMCLNIGIDPPDTLKPDPAAKMEAWFDPFSMPPQKSLETIGRNLQLQYEVWQPRARYRIAPDPSIEEIKKLCCSLRRNAKDERILFHYNGHGVPRPTPGGELWVFNKNYTQYIPVSVYDIQSWLGSPCIFVYDCSNAGNILLSFNRYAEQRDNESRLNSKDNLAEPSHERRDSSKSVQNYAQKTALQNPLDLNKDSKLLQDVSRDSQDKLRASSQSENTSANSSAQNLVTMSTPYVPFSQCIQLAACGPNEILPMHPELPADLFTCCLTTPIMIALRWFASKNSLLENITPDMISKIPGRLNDRRTPLGELNWIFTAVTDTIAWNILPHELFSKLFRQDLMVAALFRNFLLADRLMRYYKCSPMSTPKIPLTHKHAMWDAWDLAAELCLFQLPALLQAEEKGVTCDYKHSPFFAEQLSAFEIWLVRATTSKEQLQVPEQLPIVLQVLLSQVHRLRALMLLSKFLDLGQSAVNLALSVGIFPYILKLLQSPAAELKPVLVFIWAKILAVDSSCQQDLLKDHGFTYFVQILSTANTSNFPAVPNLSEHRAMCAFILSVFCDNFRQGQQACIKNELVASLKVYLMDQDPLLRQWSCLCLGKLFEGYAEAKWLLLKSGIQTTLTFLLRDMFPEVRAAALYTIGLLLGDIEKSDQIMSIEADLITSVLTARQDASPLVRKELIHTLSIFVRGYSVKFVTAAYELFEEEKRKRYYTLKSAGHEKYLNSPTARIPGRNSVYSLVWKCLLILSVDPFNDVGRLARHLVDQVHLKMMSSPLMLNISKQILSISPQTLTSSTTAMETVSNLLSGMIVSEAKVDEQNKSEKGQLEDTLKYFVGNSWTSTLKSSIFNLKSPTKRRSEQGKVLQKTFQLRKSLKTKRLPLELPLIDLKQPLVVFPSAFYQWSSEYFAEPQMKIPESEDAGSVAYTEKSWRILRNHTLCQEYSQERDFSLVKVRTMQVGSSVERSVYHKYDEHLIFCDQLNRLAVFDWNKNKMLHKTSSFKHEISSIQVVNEDDSTMLLLVQGNGDACIYQNYADDPELITAWKCCYPETDTCILVEWSQATGQLLCLNQSNLYYWDADRESLLQQFALDQDASASVLKIDQCDTCTAFVGFSNGTVCIYDSRINGNAILTSTINYKNPSAVKTLNLKRESHDLVCVYEDGGIVSWDLRSMDSELCWHQHFSSVDFHPLHSIYAGLNQNDLQIRSSTNNTLLSQIKLQLDYTRVQFHPLRTMMCLESKDNGLIVDYS